MNIDGKNKNILVFSEGPTQRLNNATITTQGEYAISFTESGKEICVKSEL